MAQAALERAALTLQFRSCPPPCPPFVLYITGPVLARHQACDLTEVARCLAHELIRPPWRLFCCGATASAHSTTSAFRQASVRLNARSARWRETRPAHQTAASPWAWQRFQPLASSLVT